MASSYWQLPQQTTSLFTIKGTVNSRFNLPRSGTDVLQQRRNVGLGKSYEIEWSPVDRQIESISGASCLKWTKGGNLLVTSMNQIFVFTKWMDFVPTHSYHNIFHQTAILHRTLPSYHPKVLVEYLVQGTAHFLLSSSLVMIIIVAPKGNQKMVELILSELSKCIEQWQNNRVFTSTFHNYLTQLKLTYYCP